MEADIDYVMNSALKLMKYACSFSYILQRVMNSETQIISFRDLFFNLRLLWPIQVNNIMRAQAIGCNWLESDYI